MEVTFGRKIYEFDMPADHAKACIIWYGNDECLDNDDFEFEMDAKDIHFEILMEL